MTKDLETLPAWFDQPVSCFKNVKSQKAFNTSLKNWITSIINPSTEAELKRLSLVQQYRETGDKKLKLKIPAFCPGALMKSRDASLLIDERIEKLTGWMQFDIDAKDNPRIESAEKLRDALANITYTAFCSLSTSGNGVWGLVKVKEKQSYKEHFEQLKADYLSLGITLDPSKGGNPTDLRYYTYDPNAYIAKELTVYDRKATLVNNSKLKKSLAPMSGDDYEKVSKAIAEIRQKGIVIAPEYDSYLKIGFALANGLGESGRELFHLACQSSTKYNFQDAERQFTACLNSAGSGITLGTFFYIVKEAIG